MKRSTNDQIGTHEQDHDKSLYLGAKILKRPQIGENSSKIRR